MHALILYRVALQYAEIMTGWNVNELFALIMRMWQNGNMNYKDERKHRRTLRKRYKRSSRNRIQIKERGSEYLRCLTPLERKEKIIQELNFAKESEAQEMMRAKKNK